MKVLERTGGSACRFLILEMLGPQPISVIRWKVRSTQRDAELLEKICSRCR